ncbi:hypothetical protein OEZ86_007457 [Tetradesmus obliquus]|nr:hypothetical protein OEZ86_007457 [Tetradesmus obliquus]
MEAEAEFEAQAWVQRSGGDLVTLEPADMDDEDTAAAILQDSLGLQPDFVQLQFTGHTLLAGAAARQLAGSWPRSAAAAAAVSSGAVINLGQMTITLGVAPVSCCSARPLSTLNSPLR